MLPHSPSRSLFHVTAASAAVTSVLDRFGRLVLFRCLVGQNRVDLLLSFDVMLLRGPLRYIPETTWTRLNKALALPPQHEAHTQSAKTKPRLQALIIDGHCLQLSKSHFGFPQAVATARRLGVERTYLTNLPHMVSHECWTYCCKKFSESGKQKAQPSASSPAWVKWNESRKQRSFASSHQGFDPFAEDWAVFAQRAIEAVADWEGPELARGEQPWVRPAADGLVLDWTAKREPQGRKLHEDAYR